MLKTIYLISIIGSIKFVVCVLAAEEGRAGGWLTADSSRPRRTSPAVNVSSASKQKAPMVNDASVSKDAMVNFNGPLFFF